MSPLARREREPRRRSTPQLTRLDERASSFGRIRMPQYGRQTEPRDQPLRPIGIHHAAF
jgi:hypothetical protein